MDAMVIRYAKKEYNCNYFFKNTKSKLLLEYNRSNMFIWIPIYENALYFNIILFV